ncbi:hypothetical protein BJ684DRAFT_18210 [Piptocephalis cylindrospora]|uniref:DH domain-containing protein n=1 Tax=Piptocephalis cylindrospora TaxID=1907219 RepID=A0A4P9YBH4_9FUNG|nr:hypothetical protein BJ684DRAFT_18210 [Piptocephalis cylindrospora]|eukprot:RKP15470.1 hypothetical protein BJ684DRAFT_18210 [Piptocephalis cylindrospora]
MTTLPGEEGSEGPSSSAQTVPYRPPPAEKGEDDHGPNSSAPDALVPDETSVSESSAPPSSIAAPNAPDAPVKKSSSHSSRASARRSRIKSVRLPKNIQPDGVMGALAATILADSSNPSDDPISSGTVPVDPTQENGHRRGESAESLAGSKKLKRRSANYDRRRSGNFNGLQLSQAFGDEASFQALAASLGGKLGTLTTTASSNPCPNGPTSNPLPPSIPSTVDDAKRTQVLTGEGSSSSLGFSSPPRTLSSPVDLTAVPLASSSSFSSASSTTTSSSTSSSPSTIASFHEGPQGKGGDSVQSSANPSKQSSPNIGDIPNSSDGPEDLSPIPLRRRRSSTKPIRMKHSQVHASMENLFNQPIPLSRNPSLAKRPEDEPLSLEEAMDLEKQRQLQADVHNIQGEKGAPVASIDKSINPYPQEQIEIELDRSTPLSSLARRLPSARPPSFTLLRRKASSSSTASTSSSSSVNPKSPSSPTTYSSKSLPARRMIGDPARSKSPPPLIPSKPSLNSLFSEGKEGASSKFATIGPSSSSTPDLTASLRAGEEGGKRVFQRQMVIRELVESEASYLKDLDVLDEVYHQGFRSLGLLRPGDLRLIFAHLDDIRAFSRTFLQSMQDATARDLIQEDDPTSDVQDPKTLDDSPHKAPESIAQCFSRLMPQMHRVYNDFCSKQDKANARVDILKACQGKLKGRTTSWDLGSLLIKPVQRVLKYPLLVHAIIKATDSSDPEYISLSQTALDLQAMADHINEVKRRRDVVERVIGRHIVLGGPGLGKDSGSLGSGHPGPDGEGKSVDGRTRSPRSNSISGSDRAGGDGEGKDQRGMASRVSGRGVKRGGKRKGFDRTEDTPKSGDLRHRLREKRREAKAERRARQEMGRVDSGLDGLSGGSRGGPDDGVESSISRMLTIFDQQRAHGRQLIRDTEAWAASVRLFLRAQCSFSSALEFFYGEDALDLGGSMASGDSFSTSPRMGGASGPGSSSLVASGSGDSISTGHPGISMMYVGGGGLSSWAGEYRRRMMLGSEEMWSRLDEALQGEIFPALEHTYMGIFAAPERVIRRWAYRLPDYRKWRDTAQGSSAQSHTTTTTTVPSTSGSSVSNSVKAGAEEYMALNSTLLEELPKLFSLTTELLAVLVCAIGRLQESFYQEWHAGVDEVRSGMIRDGYCFPGSTIGGGGKASTDDSDSKGAFKESNGGVTGERKGGEGGDTADREGPERKVMPRSVVKDSYQKAMAGEFGVLAMFTGLNVLNGNWRHMGKPRMASPPPGGMEKLEELGIGGGKTGRILGAGTGMRKPRKASSSSLEAPPPLPDSSKSHALGRVPTQRRLSPADIPKVEKIKDQEVELVTVVPEKDIEKVEEAGEMETVEEEEARVEVKKESIDDPTPIRQSLESVTSWESHGESVDGIRPPTDEGTRASIEETGPIIVEGNRRVTRTRSTLWEDGERMEMMTGSGDEEDPRTLSHLRSPASLISEDQPPHGPEREGKEDGLGEDEDEMEKEEAEADAEERVDDFSAYQLPTPVRLPDRVSLGLGPESSFMGGKMKEFLQMDPVTPGSEGVGKDQSAQPPQVLPPMPPIPPEHMVFKDNGGSSLVSRSNSVRTGASSRVVSTTFSELGMDAEMLASYVGLSHEAALAPGEMEGVKEEDEGDENEEEEGEGEEEADIEEEEEEEEEEEVNGEEGGEEEEELQYLFVCQVSFPFRPMEGSGELALKRTGDLIGVWRVDEESQWWYGVDLEGGESGWFPATYCRRVDLEDEENEERKGGEESSEDGGNV